MAPTLTVVMAYKDRPINLEYCLHSLKDCKPRPMCIVVDFGSTQPISFPQWASWLRVIRVDKDTVSPLGFHKARALNIGIQHVKTPFVCVSDVDQVFHPNFFEVVRKELSPRKYLLCKTHFIKVIPKDINPQNVSSKYDELLKAALRYRKTIAGDGCFNCVSRAWLQKVRGYDEKFMGWGFEDSDMTHRARISGLKWVNLNRQTSMVHLPHQRVGPYYAGKIQIKNKHYYWRKRRKQQIISNLGTTWGNIR